MIICFSFADLLIHVKGVVMSGCSRPISNISLYIIILRGNDQETAKSE